MKRLIERLKGVKTRRTVSAGPDRAQEVVMPDIYGERHEATEPLLKTLDATSAGIDKSVGFNPYDTVVLHEDQGVKKS